MQERIRERLYQFDDDLKKRGSKGLKSYLEEANKKPEEMMEEVHPHAERDVRIRILLNEIARENNLSVTEEEIDAAIQEDINNSGSQKKPSDYASHRDHIANGIIHDKTINHLLSIADIKEVPVDKKS